MTTFEKIYKIVSSIPKGKVLTYKRVAELANIKNPRTVGFALHKNIDPDNIPCHRVVRSNGTLATGYAFGGRDAQRKKLIEEGVEFENDKVNLQLALAK